MRALRRHHEKRLKTKYLKRHYNSFPRTFEVDDRWVGRQLQVHYRGCSCWICKTPEADPRKKNWLDEPL